jgi:hypothetical protein
MSLRGQQKPWGGVKLVGKPKKGTSKALTRLNN